MGRKSAVVSVAYGKANGREIVQIPVLIQAAEAPGTRVLYYPKDLLVRCNAVGETKSEFEIRTFEKRDAQPDLLELASADERCRFRVLDVEASQPDPNGKVERSYRIEMILSESEPFAATAKMRFREALAYQVSNIAIATRQLARTKVIPTAIELPGKRDDHSPQRHEVLLVSEVDIGDWKIADEQQFPEWLRVDFEKVRSNLTRLTFADERLPGVIDSDIQSFSLRLESSTESAFVLVRIRQ